MQDHDSKNVPSLAIPLFQMFRDPKLRDAFKRADRDSGNAFAVPTPNAPVLTGGAARVMEAA